MTPSSSCLLHAAVASVSLWAQGIVTELRLVPAIDVLARRHGIPDDVAGATLIAAGSSSPELLCTLVSIFVTHSSLGLGTIVGSEVFNLLIISAGCVYQAKGGGGELRLDRKSVLRDAGFYGASIALLYLALSDGRDASYDYADNDNDHVEMRIYVQFWKACLLSGWYVLYVAVCVVDVDPSDVARRTMGCFGHASSSSVWGGGGGVLVDGDGKSMGAEDGPGGENDGGDDDGVGVTPYELDAGSAESAGTRVGAVRDVGDSNGKVNNMELDDAYDDGSEDERDSSHADDNEEADPRRDDDLIRMPPEGASKFELGMYLALYPLRWIIHHTIPDAAERRRRRRRRGYSSHMYAYLSVASCLVWLGACSYVMVTSLESLAVLLGMPDSVMGATMSAAGTSYPAYVASRMAAEDGMGDRAVSNLFGSNTFNICVGLGVPWMAYIAISMGFDPYTDLEDSGVVESIVVLFGTLLIFVVLLASSDFVLVGWHANLFVGMYVMYIVYTIGEVYW
jgi:Ca2+/Na+ antiporter